MSGLFLIVRRSLRQHALSTGVTVASLALAAGLVMAVFSIQRQTFKAFTGAPVGFDAVLGARGAQLQLVLTAVFHLDTSKASLPWSAYEEIAADPRVALAVPYALGDSYRGHRIAGTTRALFEDVELGQGRRFAVRPGGRLFDPERREAVLGSWVARRTGLNVRDTFHPAHGVGVGKPAGGAHGADEDEHEEEYLVVGVLEPTNTPADRVIWIPIEGVFRMGGHFLRGAGEEYVARHDEDIPDEHKEVSAVMLKLKSPTFGSQLDAEINRQGTEETLAWPIARVMAELFDRIGWVNRVLALVAYLVVVVATGSIVASLYNTMNERRREFAILRSLGARRTTIFSAIVLESATISALGALCGYVVYAAILWGSAQVVRAQTGVVLETLAPHPVLWLAPLGMVALGALGGVVPALKAYRTDVASGLSPLS